MKKNRSRSHELTLHQRRLVFEMARDRRVILVVGRTRKWYGVRYQLNSFPVRPLHATMVAALAEKGYVAIDRRGYYVLTLKGELEASLAAANKEQRRGGRK